MLRSRLLDNALAIAHLVLCALYLWLSSGPVFGARGFARLVQALAVTFGAMLTFYKTPVGKKTLNELPALMQQGAEIGMARVQAHMPELQAMLQEAAKKAAGPTGTSKTAPAGKPAK